MAKMDYDALLQDSRKRKRAILAELRGIEMVEALQEAERQLDAVNPEVVRLTKVKLDLERDIETLKGQRVHAEQTNAKELEKEGRALARLKKTCADREAGLKARLDGLQAEFDKKHAELEETFESRTKALESEERIYARKTLDAKRKLEKLAEKLTGGVE